MLSEAKKLDAFGFNVLPAKVGGKAPTISWKNHQDHRTTDRLQVWFPGKKASNYWVMCGRVSGVVVLDIDSPEAEKFWRARIADEMDATTCSKTSKGHHYWFSIEADDPVASWSHHDTETGLQFDVRADGAGVIAPPSVHESGFAYVWVRDPAHLQPLPLLLRGTHKIDEIARPDGVRSMLRKLLEDPPKGEGGRNVWLASVAGHYAKRDYHARDLFDLETSDANNRLTPPLSEAEYKKTIESIWAREHEKISAIKASLENGYLISAEDHLLTPIRYKKDDEWVNDLAPWSNFDLRALGVMEGEDVARTYDVEVVRQYKGDTVTELLGSAEIVDSRQLDRWLAQQAVAIMPPPQTEVHSKIKAGARILAYLESQDPPKFSVVRSLGWSHDAFICHEGLIRADGLHGFAGTKPAPNLRTWAPFRYGFVDEAEAVRVLNEVLSFHHSRVASVFGAWWAACLLKPQLQLLSSQFPFMALEAPSESGKTTGMFSKLIQLNGNAQGQTSYTTASLRNAISGHHSGIVWIDDQDSIEPLGQLLRNATAEGSYTKMSEDRRNPETVILAAPILVTGEALQMSDQKALRDRAVLLQVPSPTQRRSTHDKDRLQWDDVVALTQQYPDLTVMAGTMVQLALRHAGQVQELPNLRGAEGKRFGDKIAILRVGARVLARMTGDLGHVDEVDAWVDEQEDTGNENSLTLKILPIALAALNWPSAIEPGIHGGPPTPVLVRDPDEQAFGVWYSVDGLAEWWFKHKNGRIEVRTETKDALTQQARAMGSPTRRRFNIGHDANKKVWCWRLPDDVAEKVLARSQGADSEDGPGEGPVTPLSLFEGSDDPT